MCVGVGVLVGSKFYMADIYSKSKRSDIMARIKSKRTGIEEQVAGLLRTESIKFRRNVKTLPGKPDFVIYNARLIIFVHGCFWHGHQKCSRARLPKTNTVYWHKKIERNKKRDGKATRLLRKNGWHVMTIWQCRLKHPERIVSRVKRMIES